MQTQAITCTSRIPTLRATTFLNRRGDLTFVWDEENEEEMLKIIEQQMREGIVFIMIEPRLSGLAKPAKTIVTNAEQLRSKMAACIEDKYIQQFFAAGRGGIIETPNKEMKTVRTAKTAREAASGESIAIKHHQGG